MHKLEQKSSKRDHHCYKLPKLPCVPQQEKKATHVKWKSPWFQLLLKEVSQCSSSSAIRGTGQEARTDWAWHGHLRHWQLPCGYSNKAQGNRISKAWHVIKAYIHLNACNTTLWGWMSPSSKSRECGKMPKKLRTGSLYCISPKRAVMTQW